MATVGLDETVAAEGRDVSKLYGNFAALRHVTCSFAVGGLHLVLGENGAGNSSKAQMQAHKYSAFSI